MKLELNKNNKWAKSSMLKKRVNGFVTYFAWAFLSIFVPIVADKAMYISLKEQFDEKDIFLDL